MATYKVIQDIEAEDKLLGPLTLRQFIYAGICALCLYLSYILIAKHAAFLVIIFAPVAIFTGFFAFPWKLNQPTEVWALAKIRFMLKPHRRIWDQSGMKELVTITAPKKEEPNYTDGLSQTEVKSRLKALADTIDSRGWAVKDINLNLASGPTATYGQSPDRLVSANTLPQEVPAINVQASDDILDEQSSPIAQQFERLIKDSSQTRRQQIVQKLQEEPAKTEDSQAQAAVDQSQSAPPEERSSKWFARKSIAQINQAPPEYAQVLEAVPQPKDSGPPIDEGKLSKRLKEQRHKADLTYNHMRHLNPRGNKAVNRLRRRRPGFHKKSAPMTQPVNPAILKLASNNDLNVATLARQVNQNAPETLSDETVISLH